MRNQAILAVTVIGALAIGVAPAFAQTQWNVAVSSYAFAPATLNIVAGDKVVWTNVAEIPHEVECHLKVAEGVEPPTCVADFEGDVDVGQSFSYVFTTPGVYLINCNLGGMHATMKQVIVVTPF